MAKTKKPTPPAWLDQNGKALFRKLASEVTDKNLESVQALCQYWQDFRIAAKHLKSDGLVVVTSTGNLRKNPAYDIAKTSLEGFVRLSKLLGLYEKTKANAKSAIDEMNRF